uniref:NADH-ubiquinone oxidoreductase chain 3 n=1 Tax=Caprella mutica TaxID=380747 RepID=E0XH08_9CRUS|nr:NADH dehydrogenase subunit 3 [Caprella mutica]ADA69728.1 NADH dehydrogenase subunit 3 [Caprella mutica]
MFSLSIMITLAFLVSAIMVLVTLMTSEKSSKEREKMTPFECGFSPMKKSRAPFSLRFFMVTLIFLIFDMEVSLVLPMGLLQETSSLFSWSFTVFTVIFILIWGLLHEWKNGALSWV